MAKNKAILVLLLSAPIFVAGCALLLWFAFRPSVTPEPTPPKSTSENAGDQSKDLVWDFTRGSSIEVVQWPAGYEGEDLRYGQFLWKAVGPGPLTVKMVDVPAQTYLVKSFQVRRAKDQIVSVYIELPCEDSESAYKRAKAMNSVWKVGQLDQLENWYGSWGPNGTNRGLGFCNMTGPYGERPRCDISILRCYFQRDRQWYVTLSFSDFGP